MRIQPLIQIIDHEVQVLEVLAPLLEQVGWHMMHADDGLQGQGMALQHQPHLIVLDLLLPKLDGLSVLQRLRRDQRTTQVPVMVLTALSSKEDKLKAFNCGADDYVLKPFEVEEVFVRIRALLRHQLETPLALGLAGDPLLRAAHALSGTVPGALVRSAGLLHPQGV